ncbi:MAG: hypothetical protein V1763_00390 [Parcubacteria group bacterium]
MSRESFQVFGLKFVDVMVGIVLGLGFQWWPDLHEPWQYIAFVFIYLNLIDYWVDYSPALKKFPPRRELDLITHIFIMFMMFLLVYSTRGTIAFMFLTFTVYRIVDICWLYSIKREHQLDSSDKVYVNTWLKFDFMESLFSVILFFICQSFASFSPLWALSVFILLRVATRILSSVSYRRVFFA